MRLILTVLFSFSVIAHAQVDMSQKEQIEQQRESDRKQDALRDSALTPNEKPAAAPRINLDIDSSAQFDVDHSSLGYSMIMENDNSATGIKLSGAFTVAIYNEQKNEKKTRLMVGLELPIDVELPVRDTVPFAGGGIQIGSGLSFYANAGLDFRLTKWFKLQAGANYDSEHTFGALAGAGLTW